MNLLGFDPEAVLLDAFVNIKKSGNRITPESLAAEAKRISFGEHRDSGVNEAMVQSWLPACQTFLAKPGEAGPH